MTSVIASWTFVPLLFLIKKINNKNTEYNSVFLYKLFRNYLFNGNAPANALGKLTVL